MNAASARPKVIVTGRLPEDVEREVCSRFDAQLNIDRRSPPRAAAGAAIRRCAADHRCRPHHRRVLEVEGRRANIIANYGVGYNHIDVAAAKRLASRF